MNVVVFTERANESINKQLRETIESRIPQKHLEIIHNIEDFTGRICRFPREIDAAVLFPKTDGQLGTLINLQDFLEDIPIVLILPDRKRSTVSKARLLSPVFIDYADGDCLIFGPVLERMIDRINNFA